LHVVAETEPQYLVAAAERARPRLIVLDFGAFPAQVCTSIRHLTHAGRNRTLSVVVLTGRRDAGLSFAALRAGARGYLYKGCDVRELVTGIHAVVAGQAALTSEVAGELLSWAGPYLPRRADESIELEQRLTPREREILHLAALGESNDAIARKLNVSKATVRSHVHHMLMKLGVGDRTQAVAYAYRVGFVSPFS
jgi:DNA-binding NarL/FixJ family response regulator